MCDLRSLIFYVQYLMLKVQCLIFVVWCLMSHVPVIAHFFRFLVRFFLSEFLSDFLSKFLADIVCPIFSPIFRRIFVCMRGWLEWQWSLGWQGYLEWPGWKDWRDCTLFEQKIQGFFKDFQGHISNCWKISKQRLECVSFLFLPQHDCNFNLYPEDLSVFAPFRHLTIWVG